MEHPVMWAELKESSLDIKAKQLSLAMAISFTDLVNKSERNETEVLSDMLLVASDVLTLLNSITYHDVFFIEPNATLIPGTEMTDNETSGWQLNVTFRIPYLVDTCEVPSNAIPPISFNDYVQIVDQDQNVIATVPCGGNYSVLVFSGIDGGASTTVYTNSIVNP
jgi:hypothetical protein